MTGDKCGEDWGGSERAAIAGECGWCEEDAEEEGREGGI